MLRPLLEAPGLHVELAMVALRQYAGALLEWNRGVSNLISRHDEGRLVERHLAESLWPATLLRDSGCERFVDLGSGAGLPAIPLAIAGVGKRWTLVESRRNKTLFVRKYLQDSAMPNIEVMTARLEVAIEEDAAALACDGFTSRATMTAGPTLALAASIVRTGGKAFLWKGSGLEQELKASEREWSGEWRFTGTTPIASGPVVVAVFEKL
jgi:16S rRNA (guanine527-N7)-methyltransferase